MEEYNCIYCSVKTTNFNAIIDHIIIRHPDCNLKIRINNDQNKISYLKNFSVTANNVNEKKKFITPIAETLTIKISKFPEYSPFKKMPKLSTSMKDIQE